MSVSSSSSSKRNGARSDTDCYVVTLECENHQRIRNLVCNLIRVEEASRHPSAHLSNRYVTERPEVGFDFLPPLAGVGFFYRYSSQSITPVVNLRVR